MERVLLLRRVLLLCCHFTRNLAYYRAAWHEGKHIRNTDFWVTTSGNSYDHCVLEWCKLFGEKTGEHSWAATVSDPAAFEAELYKETNLEAGALEDYRQGMRAYRDKFVAHLDLEQTAQLPTLDIARATTWFLHAHVVAHEIADASLGRLPLALPHYYELRLKEAQEIYGVYQEAT